MIGDRGVGAAAEPSLAHLGLHSEGVGKLKHFEGQI